ncbi:hypothetical protein MUA26_06070 [Staphylococcus sp. IVB6246]|uniref:YpoC family protein n=1 Tax=unclassified Staphylococcus TaxID=91994 RepID=UPI0021D375EA|nr:MULTISPECIES: hypothetical protein [unclassified Staphylococcus]UXR68753.1 hypothetical protein MUA26_06070 [Staphylococcus sp. IVB6246]UXR70810.1 hypothetical protein MUA88_06150 [Staphylococcus sp. IVB6240]UXR73039.1 hypothetical protein MUA48_06325 [Staphylococcus sp. IVB6238]
MSILDKMTEIEGHLDVLAKSRKIGKAQSLQPLDDYYQLLINYFCFINDIQDISEAPLNTLKIVPFNFDERLEYIQERKHHYMGYQQMKTLKSELIKMNAAYRAKNN